MSETPLIDDRRRFRELWKELLFARLCVSLLLSPVILSGIDMLSYFDSVASGYGWRAEWWDWSVVIMLGFTVGLPSLAAKKGGVVFPVVGFGAILALSPAWVFQTTRSAPMLTPCVVLGLVGTGAGLVEGRLERSLATMWCGLLGGALSGILGGLIVSGGAVYSDGQCRPGILSAGGPIALHLGIGFSLALGRWVRDWPRRGQGEPSRTAEVPP